MTIGMKQGSVITIIGPGGLLHGLMSTVALHLESGLWGARFPLIMGKLYAGSLPAEDAHGAMLEARAMREGLRTLRPDQVVWDIDHLGEDPPWGKAVGPHVTSMADYFVTTTGRNLMDEIIDNLESLMEFGGTIDIVSFDGTPRR